MSVYYSIDGAAPTFLGSNTGWSDAGHFIESLDPKRYPLLAQFRAHGWAEPAGKLAAELRACLRAESPDEDVAGVLRELLAGAGDAGGDGVLVVSDGTGEEGGDPDGSDTFPAAAVEHVVRESKYTGQITDKSGRKRCYRDGNPVPCGGGDDAGDPARAGGDPDAKKAAADLAADPNVPPEVKANPGLMARLGDALVTAAAKVKLKLDAINANVAVMQWIDRAGDLLGAALDSPDDMKKFGYNPDNGAAGTNHGGNDPLKLATGVSTHLACSLASKVLVAALGYLKGKRGKTESAGGDGADAFADLMVAVFQSVNDALGMTGVPDAAAVAAKLGELVGGA